LARAAQDLAFAASGIWLVLLRIWLLRHRAFGSCCSAFCSCGIGHLARVFAVSSIWLVFMVGIVLLNDCALCTGECSSVSFLVLQFTIVQYNISLIISVSSSHIEIGESWLLGKDRDN
jgi:hypothetical protein